ncbi:hypothetical protein I4U23_007394 [Adineta vaga]|nr:hypothetical protein I4U23_007394 [Adineta vaga]
MSDNNRFRKDRPRFVYDQSASGIFPPNRVGTESTEYTIIVQNIPASVSRQAIIDFASQFGILRTEPYITPSTEKLRKAAFLTFTEQSAVQHCMNGDRDNYTINGYQIAVQRYLATGLTFMRTYRLLLNLETNSSSVSLNEDDVRTYFEKHYGRIKAFAWTSESAATADFEDYDAIDRAVLDSIIHTINGVKIRLEKVKSSCVRAAYERTIADGFKYCVHVRNIPANVNGEQLATIFNSKVWDILIRRGTHPERDPMEAWILDIPTMLDAEELAASVTDIDGIDIQCNAETEPVNEWTLCSGNRDGWCKHDKECIYRHIICVSGDECKNEGCSYSHSKERKITPVPRYKPAAPVDQQYRIKIDGLPYSMTPTELVAELKKQSLSLIKSIEAPDVPKGATTRHFYLVRQAAEKLARKRVFEWHNYPIRECYIVKCQLEYDRLPTIDHLLNLSSTSIATATQTNNQRLRSVFAPLLPGPEEIYGMPSNWVWTNRRLGNPMNNVHLVYPSELIDDRLGAMKVFCHQNDLEAIRAKRELLALKAPKVNKSVTVHVYQSNILDVTRNNDQPLWIITEIVSELTLEDFVQKHKSEITFQQVIRITRQLLEIIQRCHRTYIVHRNLQPYNILVQKNSDQASFDTIKLVLVDFGAAWVESEQLSITDEDDVKMFKQVISKNAIRDSKSSSNLLSMSTSQQRRDPTLDSLNVCYILFWLLTEEWTKQLQYTTFPHRENENQQKIYEKLGDVRTDDNIRKQIMHIFDRSFNPSDNRWSADELLNHLNEIDKLFVNFENAQLDILFPSASIIEPLSKNDLYARIVTLIASIKQQFAQQYSSCIKWSIGCNKWYSKNKDTEVRNTDELIYNNQERHCTIPIICSAQFNLDHAIIFLGSADNDGTTELKTLCNLDKETNDMDVSKYFDIAVKRLVRDKLKQVYSS